MRLRKLEDTLEDYRDLISSGESPERAAKRVGYSPKTIQRYILRQAERQCAKQNMCPG